VQGVILIADTRN